MFKNITIKMKLIISTLISVAGLISLIIFFYFSSLKIETLDENKLMIEVLKSDMLMLRRNEKDFILRKDIKYVDEFNKNIEEIRSNIKNLQAAFILDDFDTKHINSFDKVIVDYQLKFESFAKAQIEIGLNEKLGLYGSLRSSVQNVQENAKKTENYELLSIVYDLRKQEKDFMLRRDLKYVDKFKDKIDMLLTKDFVTANISSDINNYKNDFLSLVKAEELIGLNSKQGLQGEMRETVHQTETIQKKLVEYTEKEVHARIIALEKLIVIIGGIFVFIITFLSILTIKSIIKNIETFREGLFNFFKYLSRENESVIPLKVDTKDELGEMAEVVNEQIKLIEKEVEEDRSLINSSIKILKSYEEGDFTPKINEKSSNPSLNELTLIMNNMSINLEKNIDDILKVMSDYSNSNYRTKISLGNKKAHLEKLATGVNNLGGSISELLKKSLEIGLTLGDSSNVLISNVETLNNSSNTAAASLEETAAALEEITSTIINNSQNIAEMNKYANELSDSAKQGQTQASNTTKAMEEITNQVTMINEAIIIIDQIAFQTNILSLNAAVEAATAGEAGKGFAVVAQEVRNLASRSAEAAKEIKELVGNATTKTNEGKKISADMIEGYNSLLINIEKSTKKIDEISVSSKEQETGIKQINDAVNQLDQQTQQNASIAAKTNSIAIETDSLAKEIISDAQSKEFEGKENAKLRKHSEIEESTKKLTATKTKDNKTTTVKEISKKEPALKKEKTKVQVITPKQNKDDEWESF
ncbi:methyl-accepting chemotaxis protein [uncultured Arcobacter sp.]|uniref:HAMP domain-containing methyl-accepting chemotaxis protein n=1 Tax=uncultured Arcobacter sp. TaxID=165434 RepID=UPI00261B97BB|nr:methyl-accepting chemotaxis protein [uncultured Arcobacter sp.]